MAVAILQVGFRKSGDVAFAITKPVIATEGIFPRFIKIGLVAPQASDTLGKIESGSRRKTVIVGCFVGQTAANTDNAAVFSDIFAIYLQLVCPVIYKKVGTYSSVPLPFGKYLLHCLCRTCFFVIDMYHIRQKRMFRRLCSQRETQKRYTCYPFQLHLSSYHHIFWFDCQCHMLPLF